VSGMMYDAYFGDTIKSWDGLGHARQFSYNADGEQSSEVDPNTTWPTTTAYTPTGQVGTITDPDGNKTSYLYNNLDLVSTETDPLNHNTQYGYDAVGRLTQKADRNGRTTVYAYDANSRETSEKWYAGAATGTPVDTLTFGYDAAGNLTGAANGYG